MGPIRAALKLRVELGAHEPGVVGELHDLHKAAIRGQARQDHALSLYSFPVIVVELEAVAVALGDLLRAVQLPAVGPFGQDTGILAQAHGATLLRHIHLIGHQVDDRMLGRLGELRGSSVLIAQYMAGKLNDRHLHTQTDAKIGDFILPGIAAGGDHTLDAAVAEAAGHQNAGTASQPLCHIALVYLFGVHPLNVHHGVVGGTGVVQGFHYGEIRVVELGVLTHQSDTHLLMGGLLPLHHGAPLPQVGLVRDKPQLAADHLIQTLLGHQEGHLVQRLRRCVLDDAVRLHIAKQGDLLADILGDRRVAAAHQDVRLNTQAQQLLHGVLGRLGLQFPGTGNLDDQGHMDKHHIAMGPFGRHLADSLQEGLGLDIAHGAADLTDDHIHIVAGHGIDAALDLIGDMGNDLDRGAQIVAPALPVQYGPVYLTGGNGAVAAEVLVYKTLVVAQIQVCLGAVLGNEHFPVLVGTHGARVHIDIGVELLIAHPDAPLLQQPSQRCRADAFSQAGHHAAGHEYEFC